jgi:hippurate hydrolase
MVSVEAIHRRARGLAPELVALRRRLHSHPEVGLALPMTVAAIDEALSVHGLSAVPGRAVTSRTLVIEGARPGGTVVLRADCDALPILEDPGNDPRSQDDGRMHACGHDLHTAMLVGAAALLAEHRSDIAGRVVLVWQPGEEGYEGMQAMLDEGLMDVVGAGPAASFALHVQADTLATGVFTGKAGGSHAMTGTFHITVKGAGGHGGFPHTTRDPIAAGAEIVGALHVGVTRTFDVADPVVLTVGSFHSGEAHNVIPGEASIGGTVRAFSPETAARLPAYIDRVTRGVAAAHRVTADVTFVPGYPVVMNDVTEVAHFRNAIEDLFGPGRFEPLAAPLPAGDDMGRLMQRVPGAFFMLGAQPADRAAAPNHSARAAFDESVLADGAAALAWIAMRRTASFADESAFRP